MPKTIDEYIKAFGNHLKGLEYSTKTIQGYTIAVRQLLCDVVDDNTKTRRKPLKIYNLKYTPDKLTLTYLKDFTSRLKENYEPATQRIKLSAIKYYIRYIKAKHNVGLIDEYEKEKVMYGSKKDILKARPLQDKYKEPLTEEEIKSILKASKNKPRDYAIFKTFHYTAQRVHSIAYLNVEDIDFYPKTDSNGNTYFDITIKYNKGINKTPLKIPVPQDLIDAISEYLETREEPVDGFMLDNYRRKLSHKDALFLNGNGERLSIMGIYNMQKRYACKLGITKSVFNHLWRHTSITRMYEDGMTEAQIKQISGHSKQSSAIRTYINPSKANIISKSQSALCLEKPQPTPPRPPEPTRQELQPQDNKLKDLELKLIEQLANGEISNKVYNDAMDRLKGISKLDSRSKEIVGYG